MSHQSGHFSGFFYWGLIHIYIFILIIPCNAIYSIESTAYNYYWVGFVDKKQTPYRLDYPEEFISVKSINRRINQGIAIDTSDFPVNPWYIDSLLVDSTIRVLYTSRWFNGAVIETPGLIGRSHRLNQLPFVSDILLIKPASDLNKGLFWNKLESVPQLRHSPPSHASSHDFSAASSNLLSAPQELSRYGQSETQILQLAGDWLHDRGYLGRGIDIAILDGGFRDVDQLDAFQHLFYGEQLLGHKDFVQRDGNVYQEHQHGMQVLSVMASKKEGVIFGTAVEANYWLLRTEDVHSEYIIEEYNWLAAAEFADSAGAYVINSSLGYTTFDDPAQNHTYADMNGKTTVVARAAKMAFKKGIFVVNSAGNYGNQSWRYIGSPADSPYVLAVGGIDDRKQRVSFSSVGPAADGRIKPDVMAMARNTTVWGLNNEPGRANGTSFAAPIVSGLVACLWQKYPHLSAEKLKMAVIHSSHQVNNPDSLYGYGIPNFKIAADIIEQITSSNMQSLAIYQMNIHPNPVTSHSILSLYSKEDMYVNIEIYNSLGKPIHLLPNHSLTKGYNRIYPFADLIQMPKGILFLRITSKHNSQGIKVISF